MQSKKKHLAVTLAIILLFSLSSIVQAAPRFQEGDSGPTEGEQQDDSQDSGTSMGDTIDLVKNNLGRVMSGKNNSDDEDNDADDDDDSDDGDDDDGDDDDDDDGDDDVDDDDDATDDDDDDDATDGSAKLHPVAKALAGFFDVPYEEIAELHEAGNGFGNIAKAYFFTERLTEFGEAITPVDLLNEAHGSGWGNTLKSYGIHPGAVGNGKNKNKPQAEVEELDAQGKQKGSPSFVAPGGGKGNGGVPPGQAKDKSNGNNGNGKNKDKGKDKKDNDD